MMSDLRAKPFNLSDADIAWVEKTRESMTTEEKVGQLFQIQNIDLMDFSLTKDVTREVFNKAMKYKVGGFHLFAFSPNSFKEYQQELLNEFQGQSKIPLIISGDLETGGNMGAHDGTSFGRQMQVAAADSVEVSRRYGEVIAKEGGAMGYHWHYGPVIDINYNPQNAITNTRAFGDTPEVVRRHMIPAIEGIQDNGMAACAKHWPGDGVDDRDQHHLTTVNTFSMEQWRNTYGKLYKEAIDGGVKTIMSAHIALPAYYEELGITDTVTKHTPGSLSYELNQKLLREELGFNGLIVSDATVMVGMQSHCPRAELVPRSIAAGNDMFLFVNDIDYDYNAMLEGVRNGILTEERLDEAVTRILALKASQGLHMAQQSGTLMKEKDELSAVGCAEHQDWARACAKKSVTLVKDVQNLLPLSQEDYKKVLLISSGASGFVGNQFDGKEFENLLIKEGFEVTRDITLREKNNDYDLVIYLINIDPNFLVQSLRMPVGQMGLFKWYPDRVPTLFISMGNPYGLYEMPRQKTFINTYSSSTTVQEELMNCLMGRQEFKGVSPIDAFCGQEIARY